MSAFFCEIVDARYWVIRRWLPVALLVIYATALQYDEFVLTLGRGDEEATTHGFRDSGKQLSQAPETTTFMANPFTVA